MTFAVALLSALSLDPGPAEIRGAMWTCCGNEVALSESDRILVAYSGWSGITWPGRKCPTCGAQMALASRPLPIAEKKAEERPKLLTKEERIARHQAAKRAAELLIQNHNVEPARTLDEAKGRLLPFGDPIHVGKPLSQVPRSVLHRARSWANAKKRRFRFLSLVHDIDLVLAEKRDDFTDAPQILESDEKWPEWMHTSENDDTDEDAA